MVNISGAQKSPHFIININKHAGKLDLFIFICSQFKGGGGLYGKRVYYKRVLAKKNPRDKFTQLYNY